VLSWVAARRDNGRALATLGIVDAAKAKGPTIARQASFELVGRVGIELRPADYQRGLVDSDI